MEDYYNLYPKLPTTLKDTHGAFMVRVEVPTEASGHTLVITFGSTPPERLGEFSHLLDLCDVCHPPAPFSLEDVRAEVRKGHSNVESAFEGSLTESFKATFEPEESR